MSGLLASLGGALALAALNTFGDFVWARYIPRHRVVFGLAHGVVLLMALGLHLGLVRKQPVRGALAGASVGLLAATSFYALAPLLGYSAMFVSWMALWVGFAGLDAHLRGVGAGGEVVWRGLLAAGGSGVAFYAISGIWTKPAPGGPNYAFHFICWTIAFLPGLAALLVRPRAKEHR